MSLPKIEITDELAALLLERREVLSMLCRQREAAAWKRTAEEDRLNGRATLLEIQIAVIVDRQFEAVPCGG